MNEENTKLLQSKYPKLYEGLDKSPQESLMHFGFECGDGWTGLLISLSEAITKLDPNGNIKASQVKQKFGGLRFYYWGIANSHEIANKISKIVHKYEDNSYKVCEDCGNKGSLRKYLPWVQTLCDKCYADKTDIKKIMAKRRMKK